MWGLGSICWGLRGGAEMEKLVGVLAGQRVGWTDHQGYSLLLCHVLSIEKSWWRPVLFTIQKKRSTSSKGEPSSPHDLACHSDPPAKKQRYKHFAHEHYHVSAAEHQAKRIARPSQSFASASFVAVVVMFILQWKSTHDTVGRNPANPWRISCYFDSYSLLAVTSPSQLIHNFLQKLLRQSCEKHLQQHALFGVTEDRSCHFSIPYERCAFDQLNSLCHRHLRRSLPRNESWNNPGN